MNLGIVDEDDQVVDPLDVGIAVLENVYSYHEPKPGQADIYQEIREKALELAVLILKKSPHAGHRERDNALTRLEEAVFWANASIARYD